MPALSEVCETLSAEETIELGRRLARRLKPGATVAFFGDLGAGKTTMIKGAAQELGVKETVRSPSFVVVTEYQGRVRVQHVDLYRLQGAAELAAVGFADLFRPDTITLIEWADRAGLELPPDAVRVEMEVKEGDRRTIHIRFAQQTTTEGTEKHRGHRGRNSLNLLCVLCVLPLWLCGRFGET